MELILIIVSALVVTDAVTDPDMELQLIGVGQWTVALSRFHQSNVFNSLTQLANGNEEMVISIWKSVSIRNVCHQQASFVHELGSTLPYQGYNAQTLLTEMVFGCLVMGSYTIPYWLTYQPDQQSMIAIAHYMVNIGRQYSRLPPATRSHRNLGIQPLIEWKTSIQDQICIDAYHPQPPAYIHTLSLLNTDRQSVREDMKFGCQWMEQNGMKHQL